MTPFEPILLSNPPIAGVLPVDPMLAIWVILASLILSVLAISLATTPPRSLLRRIRFNRPTARRAHSPARA